MRTLSETTRVAMRAAFERLVTGIAQAHGATAEAWVDRGYPVTKNDARAVTLFEDCAAAIGADYITMPAPMMGGEDFAYVLSEVPGAMAFLGVAPAGSDHRTNPPLHNTRMTIEESVMARGVALHCAVAERFLGRGFG